MIFEGDGGVCRKKYELVTSEYLWIDLKFLNDQFDKYTRSKKMEIQK